MKTADKMLLHSLDAVTPGGLRDRRASTLKTIVRACTYVAAFVFGLATGASL